VTLLRDHQSAFEHRHRPDLDGIRGILATCVMLLHFGLNSFVSRFTHGVWTGFAFQLSVDVFFLLSGFVLTAAQARSQRHDITGFAIKRFLRLAPVFYITTAIVLIFPPPDYPANLMPLEAVLGVPLAGVDPANFPGWSITWELYLPIIAYAFSPILPRLDRLQPYLLAIVLAALAAADMAVSNGAQLYLPRAALGLLGGHLLYRTAPFMHFAWRPWHSYVLLAGLFGVMAAAQFEPLFGAITPWLACALILSGAANDSRLLCSRPVQLLGTLSFTIYMAHIPVMRLLAWQMGEKLDANPAVKLFGIAASFLLAWLLTRYVELPMMRFSKEVSRRRKAAK
jgi:peptidoglycan/LPS O-acetylase OafA/YrhL